MAILSGAAHAERVVDGEAVQRLCRGSGGLLPVKARRDAVFCSAACRARHWRWLRRIRQNVPKAVAPSGDSRARCPECQAVWVGVEHRRGAVYCSRRRQTRARRRQVGVAQAAQGVRSGGTVPGPRTDHLS